MDFSCRSSKDNTEGVFTKGNEERRPLKMSSRDLALSKEINEEKAGAGSRLSLFASFYFILLSRRKTVLSRGVC